MGSPTGGATATGVATGGAGTGIPSTGGGGPILGTGGSNQGTGGAVTATGATSSTGGSTGGPGGNTGGSTSVVGSSGGSTGGPGGHTGGSTGVIGSSGGSTGGPGGHTGGSTGVLGSSGGSTGGPGGNTGGSTGVIGSSGGSTGSTGGSTGSSGGSTGSFGGSTDNPGGTTGSSGGSTGDPTTECVLPDLPDLDSLPRNDKLPDPFTFFDGTPVTTKAQWECRRREIQAMAAKYIYGPYPFEPDETTGTVSGGSVSITCKEGSKTETFSATISGSGDVIAIDMGSGILPNPHKSLSFGSGFENKIKSLFGLSEMNTNVATGWMVDRVLDVLEQNPSSEHDPQKMVVSGCSGCGKGAFLVGVFSRIPLTVIVESGGGGAASLRQAEWFRHGEGNSSWQCADALPQSIDNLEETGICGPWVTSVAAPLRSNPSKVYNLPFDQHLLLATIAPRHLLHFSNANGVNSWCHLGGTCEALSSWAAEPVWNALGVPERMGFHMYSAGHCSAPSEATTLASKFFKRAFEGDTSAETDVMDIMSNGVQQPVSEWEGMWIDWNMETVLE